jgi:GT2 family glycosyltransferase
LNPCIRSIINQDCADFELVVVNPEAMTREDRFSLRSFRRKSRCVITTCAEIHQKIEGEFLAILDQSVLLEPHAIASFKKAVERHNPDIVYADEAFVSGNSLNVSQISLKPAFSIDYFLASGFIGLPSLVRRNLVGPTNESWMQCCANAVSELLVLNALRNTKRVLHIPDLLSRRMLTSGERHTSRLSPEIVQRQLRNIGFSQASVERSKDSAIFQIRFYEKNNAKTAIIIPTKNNLVLLRQTVDSVNQTVPKDLYNLVIVDHESTDPDCQIYLNALSKEHIVLSYKGVFNFSKINNFAVSQLKAEYDAILFLNNDIEALQTGWLESMRDKVLRPDVGIVGANLLYPHDPGHESQPTIQHAGVILGIGVAEHFLRDEKYYDPYAGDKSPNTNQPALVTRGFSAVTAACLMTTPKVFKEVGGFDDSLAVAFGDVDLCLKVHNLGYKVLCDGEAVLVHHESATREKGGDIDPHPSDSVRFDARYRYDVKQGDPFYHPLLVKNNFRYRPIRNPVPPSDPAYRIVDNPGFINPGLDPNTPDRPD